MGLPLRILFIEDSEADMLLTLRSIRQFGYEPDIRRTDTAEGIDQFFSTWSFDLIISDFSLPFFNGLDALHICRKYDQDIPFLVVSGAIGEEIAVQMMKAGAHDYIMKNNLTRLGAAIQRELREADLRRAQRQKDQQIYESQQVLAAMVAQLQQSNLSFQQFVDAAYHDLQEPLRKILVFSALLTTKYAANLDVRALETSQKILTLAGKMQTLIQSVLSYTHLADSRQPIFVQADLGSEAKKAAEKYNPLVNARGGRIEVGELPEIEALPQTMLTLFEILIDNSVRYAKSDTPPCVRICSEYSLAPGNPSDCGIPENEISLQVIDNGIGFDEKYAEKIFDPFVRLSAGEVSEGSGIGLAIARRIVSLHHGLITARSTPQEGTVFTITLPVNQSTFSL
jgi:signal transduction histidine kinase